METLGSPVFAISRFGQLLEMEWLSLPGNLFASLLKRRGSKSREFYLATSPRKVLFCDVVNHTEAIWHARNEAKSFSRH
ncbi:hypothetical protein P6U16_08690 [Rhizobium sp. 32-5/1]|uniref:hypothetical protein n=1 Tax=Rhizobium sp. 32-5/1 TaxID=3019602 RepID=UPI00240D27CB|nr:hypothetical protein [Rhizobium sp. 32-5/1]WEZ84632.1 hypothetical protein P6U16_08690 [Rhizobium sp. 32-5/1]